jgi:enterochelin esterase family protein
VKAIVDLHKALAAAPDQARDLLQKFVVGHSFPLVSQETVTFFFWDGQPVDQVFLIHWVFGLESRQPFQRIEGTDALFLSLELPHGARIEYKFEVVRGATRLLVRDPLNPRLALDPFGANSVCPMAGYVEPPWAQEERGVRPGQLERMTIASSAWGSHRELTVYLPNEYRAHKSYPLLIVHDGDDHGDGGSQGQQRDEVRSIDAQHHSHEGHRGSHPHSDRQTGAPLSSRPRSH